MGIREYLSESLTGRVCLMGLGNPLYGDDGFGVRLASAVEGHVPAIAAGANPERFLARVRAEGYQHLVLADAVDFGAEPGSAALLSTDEMNTRFPAISTHKVPLGLLARLVEADGTTRAWLLGVQPESLRVGTGLSGIVQATLEGLADALCALGSSAGEDPQ